MATVLIIGGGPAGMMAAYAAQKNHHTVHLFEKNEQLGKKLLCTGHGRCNVTNRSADFLSHIVSNPKFLYSALHTFSNQDMMRFLEQHHCPWIEEDQGRIFPKSQKARSILDVMTSVLSTVSIHYNEPVRHLIVEKDTCIGIATTKQNYYGDCVILATGGLTFRQTGSTGDGFRMVQEIGIPIIPCRGGLVSLETKEHYDLQGISLPVSFAIAQKKRTYKDTGEILFTHFGLSGPAIINASSSIQFPATLTMQLLPNREAHEIDHLLTNRARNKDVLSAIDFLPKRLGKVICMQAKIDPKKKMHDLTKKERHHLVEQIQSFSFTLIQPRPINQAMITQGGISTKAIDAKTMTSKTIKHLKFAGEVIDVDGQTGGYNLQIAWTTGFVAGSTID